MQVSAPCALVEKVSAILSLQPGFQGLQENSAGTNRVSLKAYFDTTAELADTCSRLQNLGITDVRTRFAPFVDYNEKWEKEMEPVRISEHFWVRPSFRDFTPPAGHTALVIDPKMSFGSGHHATTRLCARLLEQADLSGKTLLDIGTGTGILAIVADLLGAGKIAALDIDPVVSTNLRENVKQNSSRGILPMVGTLEAIRPNTRFDVIVANMIRDKLFAVLPRAMDFFADAGELILSGFLREERELTTSHFRDLGLSLIRDHSEDEWWACSWRRIA